MNRQEHTDLLSQRSALERMLKNTSSTSLIALRSLKVRLDIVNRQIAEHPVDTRMPAKALLTFRGRPVVGSHGIFAEFGVTATKAFTDAVALLAASFEKDLAATGPIPNRSQNQLLITNTALGSFGFELEEHREGLLLIDDESPVAQALKQTQELLRGAAEGNDDELTDVASGQDTRAVAAVRDFLKKLIDNEAVCAVTIGDKIFSFSDVGEVQRSLARLGQDNLHEESHTFAGVFQGALPKRRSFEYKVAITGDVISGKIGPSVTDPAMINRHLDQRVEVQLVATRIGQGRPRYVLNQLPVWPDDDAII
jgi:hypothetical protein